MIQRPPRAKSTDTLFPYTTFCRARDEDLCGCLDVVQENHGCPECQKKDLHRETSTRTGVDPVALPGDAWASCWHARWAWSPANGMSQRTRSVKRRLPSVRQGWKRRPLR